jgi:hypothetical protein
MNQCQTPQILIYRGDTFDPVVTWRDDDGNPVDLTGVTFVSEIRTQSGALVTAISATPGNQVTSPGSIVISPSTALWPIGVLAWDLVGNFAGVIRRSARVSIVVEQGVTQ